jgi:RNA polymerase sigma factor (TIGR02999 family)
VNLWIEGAASAIMVRTGRSDEITHLLEEMRLGNPEATDELIPIVFNQLRNAARRLLQSERDDHTLQPTALVNDALMKLIGNQSLEWQSRAQFFGVASKIMRHILIDHARAHRSAKRGGEYKRVPLDEGMRFEWREAEALLALDQALDRLAINDSRLAQVVEMRFFAGMTELEIAEVLKVAVKTVQRDWEFARDWLYRELN